MKRIFVTVIILVPVFTSLAAEAAPSSAEKELVTIMQTILDSIATGDKEPWRRWLADDFVLLDRDGSVKLRSHLVDGTAPLKPGYELKLTMQDIESRDLGDAAVLIYRVVEEMKVFGQPLHVEYRNSHVFEKRDGRWQMLVWQYVELPRDPEPVAVDPARLNGLAGEYALSDGVQFVVSVRDGKLYGARAGRAETELIPESSDVFCSPSSEFRKIFVRDASGTAVEMIDRRKGSDTRWKRVQQ